MEDVMVCNAQLLKQEQLCEIDIQINEIEMFSNDPFFSQGLSSPLKSSWR